MLNYYTIFRTPAKTMKKMKKRQMCVLIPAVFLLVFGFGGALLSGFDVFPSSSKETIVGVCGIAGILGLLVYFILYNQTRQERKLVEQLECPKCHDRMIDPEDMDNEEFLQEKITNSGSYDDKDEPLKLTEIQTEKGTAYAIEYQKVYYSDHKLTIKCKHCNTEKQLDVHTGSRSTFRDVGQALFGIEWLFYKGELK